MLQRPRKAQTSRSPNDRRAVLIEGQGQWIVVRSGAPIHEVSVGGMGQRDGDAEQAVEGDPRVPSPVPAKDKLLKIAVEVGLAKTVQHTRAPALQVREHPMDPRQPIDPTTLASCGCSFRLP